MADLDLAVAFPQEVQYNLPFTLPGGIKEVTLRQSHYNSISGNFVSPEGAQSGVPAGLEIQIVIPQLDGCFAIPETAYLHVEAELSVKFSLSDATGNFVACGLSQSNGGILGSACSMFNRYQVYLNTAILSDDIVEFGLLSHMQFLLAFNRENRFAMAAVLGLNRYYPSGNIGQAFNGPEVNDRAYLVNNITISNANEVLGPPRWDTLLSASLSRTYPVPSSPDVRVASAAIPNHVGSSYLGVYLTAPTASVTATFAQTLRFAILLPGLLGSGSNKLFPLFIGPTRISLFTDLVSSYTWFNFPAAMNDIGTVTHPTGGNENTPTTMSNRAKAPIVTPAIYIRSIWLNIDYIRCDGPSFALIVESLPIPDTFVIKSTAWTVTSTTIPVTAGQSEVLIPHRRASCKALYCLFSPNGGAVPNPWQSSDPRSLLWSAPGNIFGKFGWVNPNLTNGTCVVVNGIMYPQQTNDPLERPDEIYCNLLRTLGVWSNDGNRPCIAPNNFFVTDFQSVPLTGAGGGKPSETLWRSYQTLSARISGFYMAELNPDFNNSSYVPGEWLPFNRGYTAGDQTIPPWTTFSASRVGETAEDRSSYPNVNTTGSRLLNFSDHHIINPGFIMLNPSVFSNGSGQNKNYGKGVVIANIGTPISYVAGIHVPYGARVPSIYIEGSMSLANYGSMDRVHDYQSQVALSAPENDQFIYAVDFEHMAKNTYLSGVSSLSGSFFLRMNVKTMLTTTYVCYFVLCHDMLTIMNAATRNSIIKI